VRRVRVHADFVVDQAAQMRWLATQGADPWVQDLIAGTRWIVRTLTRFPAIGPIRATRGSLVQRSIRYPKGPYVARYIYDESDPDGELVLVRLFHLRQEQPEPDLARWTLGPG